MEPGAPLAEEDSGSVELPDGTSVAYHAIAPENASALQRFHHRLSERSIYPRFYRRQARTERQEGSVGPEDVLSYWFPEDLADADLQTLGRHGKRWMAGGSDIDSEITERFEPNGSAGCWSGPEAQSSTTGRIRHEEGWP